MHLDRARWLIWALRVLGMVFIFGVYPLTIFWPSGSSNMDFK